MFQQDKGKDKEQKGTVEDGGAPPLKPFSKKTSHTPANPRQGLAYNPERMAARLRDDHLRPPGPAKDDADGKRLIVGRDIHLKGEITSCDKLIVEGRVEASLTDARVIEIAPSGFFKGDAQVDEADISGRFEGELIAKDKLTVRSEGRVSGSCRYGRIVIESGGEITGDMQAIGRGSGDEAETSADEEAAED
jgi:cytoskeletal protein CcmA (bactofilin family)